MQKFGAARVAQMVPFMKSVFESVGVMGYSLEGNVSSTLDSHRLLEHALAQPDGVAVQDRLIESLFRRYFTEASNLGDREVLAAACTEAEVPGEAFQPGAEAGSLRQLDADLHFSVVDVNGMMHGNEFWGRAEEVSILHWAATAYVH